MASAGVILTDEEPNPGPHNSESTEHTGQATIYPQVEEDLSADEQRLQFQRLQREQRLLRRNRVRESGEYPPPRRRRGARQPAMVTHVPDGVAQQVPLTSRSMMAANDMAEEEIIDQSGGPPTMHLTQNHPGESIAGPREDVVVIHQAVDYTPGETLICGESATGPTMHEDIHARGIHSQLETARCGDGVVVQPVDLSTEELSGTQSAPDLPMHADEHGQCRLLMLVHIPPLTLQVGVPVSSLPSQSPAPYEPSEEHINDTMSALGVISWHEGSPLNVVAPVGEPTGPSGATGASRLASMSAHASPLATDHLTSTGATGISTAGDGSRQAPSVKYVVVTVLTELLLVVRMLRRNESLSYLWSPISLFYISAPYVPSWGVQDAVPALVIERPPPAGGLTHACPSGHTTATAGSLEQHSELEPPANRPAHDTQRGRDTDPMHDSDSDGDSRFQSPSISDLDLDRSSPVPPVDEEDEDDSGRGAKGTGAKPLPSVDPLIVQHICRQFPQRMARARELSRRPPIYGVAYRDVLRLRIIGGALADLGLGTSQGNRTSVTVHEDGRNVRIRPEDVMVTLGMRPSTYRSVRSRLEKVQSVYTWLGQNKHVWEEELGRHVFASVEHRAYHAMKALFGPDPLPTRRHVPREPLPAGVHDAVWENCKTFLDWAETVIERYNLVQNVNLPVSPEFYDVTE
ncbi:hypothetical protein C8T65DRAFT_739784 [Cerioporus squamosus]|nr:hypothetical protein C8T65DRAFT_739784 [Cerioporus squamosus]